MVSPNTINGKNVLRVNENDEAVLESIHQATNRRVRRDSPDGRPPSRATRAYAGVSLLAISLGLALGGVIAFYVFGNFVTGLIATAVYAIIVLSLAVPVLIAGFARAEERARHRRRAARNTDSYGQTINGARVIAT